MVLIICENMKKKILSTIVSFAMFFSCLTSVNATYSNYEFFSEQDVLKFKQSCDFLEINDIFNLNNRDISATITRSEFAQILTNLMNEAQMAEVADVSIAPDFSDDYAKYEAYAVESGYMKLDEHGKFLPNQSISYNEAIYGLVHVLGYGLRMELEGRSNSAYLETASSIGLLKNVDNYADHSIVLGALIVMIENALTIDFFGYNFIDKSYEVLYGKNILSECHNITKKSGVLYGTPEAHVFKTTGVGEGMVEIEGITYYTDNDYSNYLGMCVDYYYTEEMSGNEMIVYMAPNKKNDVFVVDAKDIQFDGNSYTYDNERKLVKVETDVGILTILNGSSVPTPTLSECQPENGYFEFIDNNGDEKYDIVRITSYSHYVVGNIEPKDKVIYDKYHPVNRIYVDELNYVKIFDQNGIEIPFSSISKDDVLTIVMNKQKTVCRLYVSKSFIEGTITQISNDEYEQLKIENTLYQKASDYPGGDNPAIGAKGIFRLNTKGQIVCFETSNDGVKFGYLINAKKIDDEDIPTVLLKIFSQDNKIIKAPTKERVKIDGKSYKDADKVYTALSKGFSEPQKQVIQYELIDGEISSIVTAYNNKMTDMGKDPTTIVPTGSRSKNSLRVIRRKDNYYASHLQTLGNVGVGGKTIKFVVPNGESDSSNDYGIMSSIETDVSYTCELYSCSDSNIFADAMVLYAENVGQTTIGVVAEINYELDKDDIPCKKIKILKYPDANETIFDYNNVTDAVQGFNDENLYELGVGDTIQYSTKGLNKEIGTIKLLCDASEKGMNRAKFVNPTGGIPGDNMGGGLELRFSYGAIYDKVANFFQLAICNPNDYSEDIPTELTELYTIDGMFEIVVDTTGRKITVERSNYSAMNFKDFKHFSSDCDYGFTYLQYGWARVIVVYK